MTASESCRKRSRSEEDDCDECLPISKRITKLHIRYEGHTATEDCLEPLLTNNNNVPGLNCCQQTWTNNYPATTEGSCSNGSTSSQQSPPGQPVIPSSPPWQSGGAPPGASLLMSEQHNGRSPELDSILHNRSLMPSAGSGGLPISNNMLHVPGSNNQLEQFTTSLEQYDPELTEMENPHYYQTNQVLYYAHMSRLQRISPEDENQPAF